MNEEPHEQGNAPQQHLQQQFSDVPSEDAAAQQVTTDTNFIFFVVQLVEQPALSANEDSRVMTTVQYISDSASALLGTRAEELLGKSDYLTLASTDVSRVQEMRRGLLAKQQVTSFAGCGDSYHRVGANGALISIEATYYNVFGLAARGEEKWDSEKDKVATTSTSRGNATAAIGGTVGGFDNGVFHTILLMERVLAVEQAPFQGSARTSVLPRPACLLPLTSDRISRHYEEPGGTRSAPVLGYVTDSVQADVLSVNASMTSLSIASEAAAEVQSSSGAEGIAKNEPSEQAGSQNQKLLQEGERGRQTQQSVALFSSASPPSTSPPLEIQQQQQQQQLVKDTASGLPLGKEQLVPSALGADPELRMPLPLPPIDPTLLPDSPPSSSLHSPSTLVSISSPHLEGGLTAVAAPEATSPSPVTREEAGNLPGDISEGGEEEREEEQYRDEISSTAAFATVKTVRRSPSASTTSSATTHTHTTASLSTADYAEINILEAEEAAVADVDAEADPESPSSSSHRKKSSRSRRRKSKKPLANFLADDYARRGGSGQGHSSGYSDSNNNTTINNSNHNNHNHNNSNNNHSSNNNNNSSNNNNTRGNNGRLPSAMVTYLTNTLGLTTSDVNAPTACPIPELRYPLIVAAAQNDPFRISMLLALGADANLLPIEVGFAALHMAVMCNSLKCVQLLLAHGANVNIVALVDGEIATPLTIACKEDYVEVADCLLQCGALVNYRDHEGNTPLHYAVGLDNVRMVRLLLKHRADVLAANADGYTPAAQADEASECAEVVNQVARELTEVAAELLSMYSS